MATSRTGTSRWKNLRKVVLYRAKAQGLKHCPECKIELDYKVGLTPASAEVDHIVAHAFGGQDVIENCRTICRRCNQSLGGKTNRKPVVTDPLKTSREW